MYGNFCHEVSLARYQRVLGRMRSAILCLALNLNMVCWFKKYQ